MTCDLNIAAVWETRESYWLTIAHSVREYEIGSRNSAVRSFLYHRRKFRGSETCPRYLTGNVECIVACEKREFTKEAHVEEKPAHDR